MNPETLKLAREWLKDEANWKLVRNGAMGDIVAAFGEFCARECAEIAGQYPRSEQIVAAIRRKFGVGA